MANVRELVDTLALNFRMRHWHRENVFEPFGEPLDLTTRIRQERADIDSNRHLSPEGKVAARDARAKAAREALQKWHEPRLAGLDADIAARQAGLLPDADKPDPKRVEFMAALMQRYTPQENATFYNSASDAERIVMEHASALLGRVPMKNGNVHEWRPLLDSDTVTEAAKVRAVMQNPQGVEQLNELMEVRAMHVTVAKHALAEINEVMSR